MSQNEAFWATVPPEDFSEPQKPSFLQQNSKLFKAFIKVYFAHEVGLKSN